MASNRPLEAAASFAEGVRRLTPFVQRLPEAFAGLAQGLIRDYRSSVDAANIELDASVLEPVEQVIGTVSASNNSLQEALKNFEPLLQAIAQVALGDDEPRAGIEERLTTLEGKGWQIKPAVHRIWAGERNSSTLTAGLDDQDTALINRILEIIAETQP